MKSYTTVERESDRALVVTRTFNGPARIAFEAWTQPALFERWWVPKSVGMMTDGASTMATFEERGGKTLWAGARDG
jgi:uncharacterized protein YndB with AHSA1/START domain